MRWRLESCCGLQAALMAYVKSNKALEAQAGDAFRSFVGAYATNPQHLRHIFHIKRLHLGHVAHSFALKEPPRRLGQSQAKAARKQSKDASQKVKRRMKVGSARHEYQTSNGLV